MTLYKREGRKDEAARVNNLVEDAVMDTICSRAFHGRSCMGLITEGSLVETEERGHYAGHGTFGYCVQDGH